VRNAGNYDGEEVVQLYVRDMVGSVVRPVKELKGFQKIALKKGETKEIRFTIGVDDLRFYNDKLQYIYEPGDFKVFVGGNSRDVKEGVFTVK
jgi:beta-glucosidase